MLQEPVHDAGHRYVLGDARDAGPEAAESADVEVDLHPRDGCLVEAGDDVRIDQAVGLQGDVSGAGLLADRYLPLDLLDDGRLERERGDQEVLVHPGAEESRQGVEKLPDILPHLLVGGKERDVAVLLGCRGVVVP
jgi:hypothetical protein